MKQIVILVLIFTVNTSAQIDLLNNSSSAFYVSESYKSTKHLSDAVAKDILRHLNEGIDKQPTVDKFVLTNEYDNLYTGNLFLSDGNYFSIKFSVKVVYDGSSVRWTIPPMQEWFINPKAKDKNYIKKEELKKKPKPKLSKETQHALNSLLNGNYPKGEGDDKIEGLKEDPDSNKYQGNGSGGNNNLAGRKALSKPTVQPDCQEEGIVVVRITVNKNGKVISAIPGVKGSTNMAACLLKPAKEAALKTIWNADENAPSKQIGTIIYKFSLTK